ncbi:hypothetical protein JOL79_19720 [Microbispora sp. RL4-1S]|uniref:Uncharacterized protein n=1 Tax=Microbispora oryzae TaxID=2806554 RepID=A0A940WS44_9ACTN|nr:hypothetical protein [Microbispora oryzae]MBP2706041.1 hypothetical protein [Microbispora oryzae]
MLKVDTVRLREPAAWLMVAVVATGTLVAVARLLTGTAGPLGGELTFGVRSAAALPTLASPVFTALAAGAVVLTGKVGDPTPRARQVALGAAAFLGLGTVFGVISLLGVLVGDLPAFRDRFESLITGIPMVGLAALGAIFALNSARALEASRTQGEILFGGGWNDPSPSPSSSYAPALPSGYAGAPNGQGYGQAPATDAYAENRPQPFGGQPAAQPYGDAAGQGPAPYGDPQGVAGQNGPTTGQNAPTGQNGQSTPTGQHVPPSQQHAQPPQPAGQPAAQPAGQNGVQGLPAAPAAEQQFGAEQYAQNQPPQSRPAHRQQQNHGQDQHGQDQHGQSQHGQSQYAQQQYGKDQYGQDQHGQEQYSQEQYSQEQYAQQQYGQGQYNQDQYSQDQYSQDRPREQYGAAEGDPYSSQPTYGTADAGSPAGHALPPAVPQAQPAPFQGASPASPQQWPAEPAAQAHQQPQVQQQGQNQPQGQPSLQNFQTGAHYQEAYPPSGYPAERPAQGYPADQHGVAAPAPYAGEQGQPASAYGQPPQGPVFDQYGYTGRPPEAAPYAHASYNSQNDHTFPPAPLPASLPPGEAAQYDQGQPYGQQSQQSQPGQPAQQPQQGTPYTGYSGASGAQFARHAAEPAGSGYDSGFDTSPVYEGAADPREQQLAQAYQQAQSYQQVGRPEQQTSPQDYPERYDNPLGHPQQTPGPYQPQAEAADSTLRFDPVAFAQDPLGDAGRREEAIDPTAIYAPDRSQAKYEEGSGTDQAAPRTEPNLPWYGSER